MLDRQISKLANERFSLYPVVAIIGPGQVGKTTLVKEFRKANPDHVLYFDLENYADRQAFLEDRFLFFNQKQIKPSYSTKFNICLKFSKILEV